MFYVLIHGLITFWALTTFFENRNRKIEIIKIKMQLGMFIHLIVKYVSHFLHCLFVEYSDEGRIYLMVRVGCLFDIFSCL